MPKFHPSAFRLHPLIGFTLVELLVVVAITTILITLLLPALSKAKDQARQITCVSNLHQMALGTQQYVNDNDGFLFPWTTPVYPGDNAAAFYLLAPYVNIKPVSRVGNDANTLYWCPTQSRIDTVFTPVGYTYPQGWWGYSSYGYNHELNHWVGQTPRNITEYPNLAVAVLFYEWRFRQPSEGGYNPPMMPNCSSAYSYGGWWKEWVIAKPAHNGRNYFAFLDGHVQGIATRPTPADYVTNDMQWVPPGVGTN